MEISVKGEPKEIAALVVGLQERQASNTDEVWERFRRKVKRNLPKAAGRARSTLTLSLDSSDGDGSGQKCGSEARVASHRQALERFLERSLRQHRAPLQWRLQWHKILCM